MVNGLFFSTIRVEAVREELRANFYSKKLVPEGKRHPMVKVQLLAAAPEMLGKLLASCNAINEQTSQGIQKQTLPLKIMTVRKLLRNLTADQVDERFPAKVSSKRKTMWIMRVCCAKSGAWATYVDVVDVAAQIRHIAIPS